MKLYHGSKNNLTVIPKSQALIGENALTIFKNEIPEKECLNAIYLTPDYGFALACAVRPEGITDIDSDHQTITFEKPELFDPAQTVFVYEVEAEKIAPDKLIKVDERQYAVIDTDAVEISQQFEHRAQDVQKYFELKNWPREKTGIKIK